MKLGDQKERVFQYTGVQNEVDYKFYFNNGHRELRVLNEREYELDQYMAPPKVIDFSKIVISPMPGKVVSISVEEGDEVQDGQEVCTIEAMKMQNLIKSERSAKVKSVTVKSGDSVEVDQVLIEFE